MSTGLFAKERGEFFRRCRLPLLFSLIIALFPPTCSLWSVSAFLSPGAAAYAGESQRGEVTVAPFPVTVESGGKQRTYYGLVDAQGTIVLPPRFEMRLWRIFGKSNYIAISDNDIFGLVDRDGRVVLQPSLEYVVPDPYFGDHDLLPAVKGGKYGFVVPDGKWLIQPRYNRAEPFFPGRPALVGLGAKSGYIDRNGDAVTPMEYDHAEPFYLGEVVQVRQNGKCGFIDVTGTVVVPLEYDETEAAFSGPFAAVRRNGKSGYITPNNDVVVPLEYDEVEPSPFLHAEVAAVRARGRWILLRSDGSEIPGAEYETVDLFDEDKPLFRVRRDGKWGYIDKTGHETISPRFSDAGVFSQGLAAASLDGESYGYIDVSGDWTVSPVFREAGAFAASGLAPVRRDSLFGVIDTSGKMVVEPMYDAIASREKSPYLSASAGSRRGKLDADGVFFDELADFENGLTIKMKDGQGGYCTKDGKIVLSVEMVNGNRRYRDKTGAVIRALKTSND